jgi:hypothetical protein
MLDANTIALRDTLVVAPVAVAMHRALPPTQAWNETTNLMTPPTSGPSMRHIVKCCSYIVSVIRRPDSRYHRDQTRSMRWRFLSWSSPNPSAAAPYPGYDEGHHSRIAILRRIRDESESADHFSIDHVVLRAAGSVTTLLLHNTKVVLVESCVWVRLYGITFVGSKCRHRLKRTSGLALWRLPIQPVLFARVADELHSVLLRAAAIMTLGEILGLSVGQGATDVDDRQLVRASLTQAASRNVGSFRFFPAEHDFLSA